MKKSKHKKLIEETQDIVIFMMSIGVDKLSDMSIIDVREEWLKHKKYL